MKTFSSSASAVLAQHPRTAARVVLGLVASVLVMLLVLMGMSAGPNGATVFAQETESPTESPSEPPSTEPAIQLLNPTPYDVGFPASDPPAVSDANDGVDELYHLVAWTANTPPNAVIEAYYTPKTAAGVPLPEITIGALQQVPGAPDTWEYYWDIPQNVNDGPGEITVRLFTATLAGFEEVANDTVEVEMENKDEDAPPNGDGDFVAGTVELTWPTQNGELGFYKPRGGAWRTLVDISRSSTGYFSYIHYTKSAPGVEEPEWTLCASAGGGGAARQQCTLAEGDRPSELTALRVILEEAQDFFGVAAFSSESSDAHRIRPYVQHPSDMSFSLAPLATTDAPGATYRRVVQPNAQTGEPHQCLALVAEVRDDRERLVQGANIDVHAVGPNDQLQFGDEDVMANPCCGLAVEGGSSSAYKVPDRGNHAIEPGENCDRGSEEGGQGHNEKPLEGEQGDHNRPAAPDEKHRESPTGSGLSGGSGAGFGRWNFHLWSPNVGLTDVTAWIDDEPLATESETRAPDTDTLEEGEPSANVTLQWLPSPMSVSIDPPSDTAAVGDCNKYTVRVRSGTTAVRGINVDVHATGPNNDLDFCDPGEGSPREAPQNTGNEDEPHAPEDEGEAHHRSDSPENPETQHTEGQTDDQGNFVIGITSPVSGDSLIEAWIDGEKEANNDVQDSAEASARATKSWASSIEDAEVSFMNPSPYGGSGSNVSRKEDADSRYHIVTRVDAVGVPGVELHLSSDDGTTFTKIGDASQVGGTDTWELFWDVNVPDGDYILRAQIAGTNKIEDQNIVVNNTEPTPQTPDDAPAFETVEITRPTNGQSAPFIERKTPVTGVASAGTEGVDLFYTKVGAKDTPQSADWISCGFAQPGDDNRFEGECTLQGSDQAAQVKGIAAIAYDCVNASCNPAPGTTTSPRQPGARESGDAHRVFGFEGRPFITMEPAEASDKPETCRRFVVAVFDETGQAMGDQNVDIHLTGPSDDASFCTPPDGASARRAPTDGGHTHEAGTEDQGFHEGTPRTKHVEGETNSSGRFSFGITSSVEGDSQLESWVDQNDNDTRDDEPGDTSVMHWSKTGSGGGGPRECTITGDSGNNTLRGTAGDDVICGRGGKDTIHGLGGNDIIRGGGGHDDLRGNGGNDRIFGSGGLDILRGGKGNDVMNGNAQDDVLRGFTGNDRLIGGSGDDSLRAGGGRDVLRGKTGNDTMNGGRGFDRCSGGRGRDIARNCER